MIHTNETQICEWFRNNIRMTTSASPSQAERYPLATIPIASTENITGQPYFCQTESFRGRTAANPAEMTKNTDTTGVHQKLKAAS